MDIEKFIEALPIQQPPLRLDLIREQHLEDLASYCTHEGFYEHMEYAPLATTADGVSYFRKKIADTDNRNCVAIAIEAMDIGRCVGNVVVHNLNTSRHSAELGFGVNPEFWGKGVLSQALPLVRDLLAAKAGVKRMTVITASSNRGAIKASQKAGFEVEGCLKAYYYSPARGHFDATVLAYISDT